MINNQTEAIRVLRLGFPNPAMFCAAGTVWRITGETEWRRERLLIPQAALARFFKGLHAGLCGFVRQRTLPRLRWARRLAPLAS